MAGRRGVAGTKLGDKDTYRGQVERKCKTRRDFEISCSVFFFFVICYVRCCDDDGIEGERIIYNFRR